MTRHAMQAKAEFSSTNPAVIAALKIIVQSGWQYLSPARCLELRGSNREVVLRPVLEQLLKSRRFEYNNQLYPLSDNGISQIINKLSSSGINHGLMTANQRLYDDLCLGITVTELMPDGKKHLPTITIIDWQSVDNNQFQVTDNLKVANTSATGSRQSDIVGYVNGLPLVVIEAKKPAVDDNIWQMIHHQSAAEIPLLFAYSQLLLAISATEGRYATTGTQTAYWTTWQEKPDTAENLNEPQQLLTHLLNKSRVLEMIRFYLLFDKKMGKVVARYPQFFAIGALLKRISQRKLNGSRQGGVLWHTAGSGKSLTLALFCKVLLRHCEFTNCRIIVVTDRPNLDRRLADDPLTKVTSGKQLAKRIGQGNERLLFSLINKFNTAIKHPGCYNPSNNLIVVMDECHESQNNETTERIKQALPNAAFIAFTGIPTPAKKKDQILNQFGRMIHSYTVQQAVDDHTITPVLYEDRSFPDQDQEHNRIKLIAADIANHLSLHFKPQGLKGQLACEDKLSAIRYQQALDATDKISSRIVMSAPDEAQPVQVQQWWQNNIDTTAQKYEKQTIEAFASPAEPDIVIVIDKLLSDFDQPRNAVLYIDRPMEDHQLYQATARVNRLHRQKPFGYLIDYTGKFNGLKHLPADIATEYKRLPLLNQRLQRFFAYVKPPADREQYRQVLMPRYQPNKAGGEIDTHQSLREDFYQALTRFGMCLKTALSSNQFYTDPAIGETQIQQYQDDLRFFTELRHIVRHDAMELSDYSLYDQQINQLVEKQLVEKQLAEKQSHSISKVQEPPDIYKVNPVISQSDTAEKIRNETNRLRIRAKHAIEQDLADDPYAQKVLSTLLKQTIEQAEALSDQPFEQYRLLNEIENKILKREVDDLPDELIKSTHAQAYYGVFKLVLGDDHFVRASRHERQQWIDQAFLIETIINQALEENSLNPLNSEAAISKALLPQLFTLVGLENAKAIIEQLIGIARVKNHK